MDSTQQALMRIVRDFPSRPQVDLAALDQDELIRTADEHRVSCLVAATCRNVDGLTPAAADRLRLTDLRRRFNRASLTVDLDLVCRALDGAQLPWVVVKGPALSEELYAEGVREFSDLDVVLSGRDLERAVDALVSAGAVLVDRDFELLRAFKSGEIGLRLPGGTLLDLHWHLIHEHRVRQHFRIDVDAMLARRRPCRLAEVTFPTVDAVDRLLHLCLHACLSGGERLLWAKDIDLAFRNYDWDHGEFLARVRAGRVQLPVALMLLRARELMGTPVSAQFIRELEVVPLWSSMVRLLERLSPVLDAGKRRNGLRQVYRSTRGTLATTVAEVLRVALYATVLRGRIDRAKPWRLPRTSPGGNGGQDGSRALFLNEVAREAAAETAGTNRTA